MLSPKKVKWRKQQKGRMTGLTKGAAEIAFGEYGHAVLADVDGAYLLIKVYPARVCALNPNG